MLKLACFTFLLNLKLFGFTVGKISFDFSIATIRSKEKDRLKHTVADDTFFDIDLELNRHKNILVSTRASFFILDAFVFFLSLSIVQSHFLCRKELLGDIYKTGAEIERKFMHLHSLRDDFNSIFLATHCSVATTVHTSTLFKKI